MPHGVWIVDRPDVNLGVVSMGAVDETSVNQAYITEVQRKLESLICGVVGRVEP